MSETLIKQKNILEYLFTHTDNPHKEFLIPKKNILTLNLSTVYEQDDETYRFFKGEKPSDAFLDTKLNFKSITGKEFNQDKKINKESITSEFLSSFKDQYEKLINFLATDKTTISKRTSNELHDGSINTVMSSKHGDIDIYLFEGFNYSEHFNQSEKDEFTELMKFYDSLWEKRDEIYSDELIKYNKLKETIKEGRFEDLSKKDELKKIEKILEIKKQEDAEKIWIKDPTLIYGDDGNWDTLYRLDNLLRHGIEGKLGWFTEDNQYENAKKLLDIRRTQLNELNDKLINELSCPQINNDKDYINNELQKLTTPSEKYIPPQLIKIKAEERVINKCNKIQWSKNEESIEIQDTSKIDFKKLLFQFVDFENRHNPLPKLDLNKRQYIYGFGEDIEIYKKLKQYFRIYAISPAPINCYKNLIYYSQLLNKLETVCATNSDMLFPMRFVLKNPYKINRSLNKLSLSINPIQLLKYKFIGMISFKRKENSKNISYTFFILKNIDGEKKLDFHYINGKFSHFVFIDLRLQKSDINTIFPLKNITWDEFNMVRKYLKKPIYYYKEDIEQKKDLIHLFIHNTKYKIPQELYSQIKLIDPSIYNVFNISYKNLYDKTNPLYLLKSDDINLLFSNLSLKGGSRLYNPKYITNYKTKNIYLDVKYRELFKKYEQYLINSQLQLFALFNPYLLINNPELSRHLNNKISDLFLNINNNINIRHYESLFLFNLINKNNMDILEINNYINFSIFSALFIAKNKKISVNCDTHLFPFYNHESFKPSSYFNNIDSSNKVDIFNNNIDKNILINVSKKYDLICNNINIYSSKLWFTLEEQSLNIKFIFIIYSLLRLNKGGNLVIGYGDISTIQSVQIINNLTPYFNEIIIYDEETKVKYKQTGTNIICNKFKDNFNIKNFNHIIEKIFTLDNTLGNKFIDINNNLTDVSFNEDINIYIDNYSVNKEYNEDLLNQIKKINYKKHFFILKSYYDVIMTIKKFINTNDLRENITKHYEYIRIICSYKKGIELKVVERTDMIDAYVKELVKKLKKNTIITKNIAIYKKMKSIDINETLNIEKLNVIKDFYYFIQKTEEAKKKVKNNHTNIFDLIDFDKYKSRIYSLLENNKDLYISFNDDDLYNIDIIHKKDEEYKMSSDNKNFIDNILIKLFNEIIDHVYDKQNINYYLDMYNL